MPYEGEIVFSNEPSTHHPTMDPPGIDMSEPTSQDCVNSDTDDDMGSDLPIPQDSVLLADAAASTPDTDGSNLSASQVSVTPVSTL